MITPIYKTAGRCRKEHSPAFKAYRNQVQALVAVKTNRPAGMLRKWLYTAACLFTKGLVKASN